MSTETYIVLGCALVACLLVGVLLKGAITQPKLHRKRFLTAPELRFWRVLKEALPGYTFAPQVAMGALLRVEPGHSPSRMMTARNRFAQKIVDFVVVDDLTGDVVAVVELDDRSHDAEADSRRDAMLAQGGYSVFRFANSPWPTASAVRERMAPIVVPRECATALPAKRRFFG